MRGKPIAEGQQYSSVQQPYIDIADVSFDMSQFLNESDYQVNMSFSKTMVDLSFVEFKISIVPPEKMKNFQ